jgi:serine protease Do
VERRAKSARLVLAAVVLVGLGVAGGAVLVRDRDAAEGRGSGPTASTLFTSAARAEPASGNDFSVLQSVNRALRDIVAEATESVVRVDSTTNPGEPEQAPEESEGRGRRRRGPFDLPFDLPFGHPDVEPRHGLGSGIIVREDGYILTNNHVVEDADVLTVTLADGREFAAELVGTDPKTDLAVIHIDETGLVAMPLANSDELQVGEFVIAIGAPFGLSHSASFGMVSGKGRDSILPDLTRRLGDEPFEDFIQTDAAINPGNSGGPLLNIEGELVGVNTAISSSNGQNAGVGFAVSSKLAGKVLGDIIERGKVVRAWLGVTIQKIDDDVAQSLGLDKPQGALVSSVLPGSPASEAGLKPFDVILAMDGSETRNPNHLRNYISSSPVGHVAELTILRDGESVQIGVTLGELDDAAVAGAPARRSRRERDWTGMIVADMRSLPPAELDAIPGDVLEGVVVTSVRPGSPAAENGITSGTIIIAMDGVEVRNRTEYRDVLEGADESIILKLRKGDNYGLEVLKRGETTRP